MPNTFPHTNIDLQEVSTRNDHARHIVAGFASAMPALADIWRYLDDALNDTAALSAEITRLSAELETRGLTAPTCSPRCAPPSPRTPTASQTRCGTSGTSWTRLRASLRPRGGDA